MGSTTFLGLANASLEWADVAILSVPFDGTACYGKGTARGPAHILEGTTHLETFDEELAFEFEGALNVATLPPFEVEAGEPAEAYLQRVTRLCQELPVGPALPLTLGGEHSITPAVMAGLYPDPSRLTVVQIDAHADLRREYEGTPYSHACAMRQVLDLGVRRLVAVGIRSAEAQEYALARDDERISTYYAHELQDRQAWSKLLETLRQLEGDLYLTIDVDGLDLPWCPGTGTPMPGGLSWYETVDVLRASIREGTAKLVGADITETAPQAGSQVNEMVAAKLAMKILSYRFAPRP